MSKENNTKSISDLVTYAGNRSGDKHLENQVLNLTSKFNSSDYQRSFFKKAFKKLAEEDKQKDIVLKGIAPQVKILYG